MSDDADNNVNSSSLDHRVDEKIAEAPVRDERLNKGKVADQHVLSAAIKSGPKKSQTMSEIERIVATETLPYKDKKLSQFGIGLNRKNDFRLKDLTRRLNAQTARDFEKEISTGPIGRRIRDFDIQSQSMRQIAANAALGSYQFQRNQVLPYMRKSLTQGYVKIDLLKKMVGAVDSLEKAVVAKLEAIKMNTAASAPKKLSLFGSIFKEVREQNIRRIAGNFSNAIMDHYGHKYHRLITPAVSRLNRIIQDGTPRGGINGVTGALTRKLNSIRHSARSIADQDGDPSDGFTRLKKSSAGLASTILGGAVQFGHNHKLSDRTNGFFSKLIRPYSEMAAKLNPFDRPMATLGFLQQRPEDAQASQSSNVVLDPSGFIRQFRLWRREYRKDQDILLDHVGAIRYHIVPPKLLSDLKQRPLALTPRVTATPGGGMTHRITLPGATIQSLPKPTVKPISFSGMGGITLPHVTPPTHPTVLRHSTPVSKATSIPVVTKSIGNLREVASQHLHPQGRREESASPDRRFFGSIFGKLADKLGKIDQTIRKSDTDRTKQQSLLDKLSAKAKVRKGSYEDLVSQRKAALLGLLPFGARAEGLSGAGAEESEGLAEAKAISGRTGSANNDGYLAAALGFAGSSAGWVGKKALRLGWRGTKFGARKTGQYLPKVAKLGWRGAKGLTKFSAKEMWGLAKLGGRIGGKGSLGLLKFGGKNLLKFGKSGLGLGLAAGIGKHYWDKNTHPGGVRRTGDTALDMLQYGSIGAEIGSLFGGIGAAPGAAIGAAVGAVIANADYAAKALGAIGHGAGWAIKGLWTTIFGQSAIVRPDGTVVRREKSSILGDVKIAFFGRKAKYSSSGDIIAPERMSIFGDVQYGFQKMFFGDKYSNGEYKQGTSILAMATDGVAKTLKAFGNEIMSLPGQVKRGFLTTVDRASNAAKRAKDKIVQGGVAVGGFISRKYDQASSAVSSIGSSASSAINNFSLAKVGDLAKSAGSGLLNTAISISPIGFGIGASNAAFGWITESGAIDNPNDPHYAFITEVLNAYGVKDRNQYKMLHSLETSQDKVNNGQAKPFDDSDMAYMAGRFGLDPKNKDAVNYFKLWYKRRFLPAMALIGRVLKAHKVTFDSALSTNEKEITALTDDLKKEIASSDLRNIGLEPTAAAFNKYAKIGAADPGGATPGSVTKTKPFDPRDPSNRSNAGTGNVGNPSDPLASYATKNNYGGSSGSGGYNDNEPASRNSAKLTKGGVKDQPEFKAAYAKLPDNIKKMVDKSVALQFVLWSTSVQHGADNASKIFQKDYSDKLTDKDYIRSIYQDRSTRFSNLGSGDRSEAISHLSDEERFAMGIQNGTNNPDIGTMGREISNVINPSGNSNLAYDPSSLKPVPVTGDKATRAKDAISYLMSKKYTKMAATAIVANLMIESGGLKTNAVGDNGRAYGLAQWHPDRRNNIFRQFKKPVENMNFHEQLDAVDWEITSGSGVTGHSSLKESLNNAPDIGTAVADLVDRYERPADRQGNKIQRTRVALGLMQTVGTDGAANNNQKGKSTAPSAPASGGGSNGSTPQSGGARTAPQKKAPSAPASAKPTPAQPHPSQAVFDQHAKELQAHTAALNNHAQAITKGGGAKPQSGGTTIITPISAAASSVGGFISMQMKKAQVAVGEM